MDVSKEAKHVFISIDRLPAASDVVTSHRSTPPSEVTFDVGVRCVQDGKGCFAWDRDPLGVLIDEVSRVPR